VRAIDPRFDFGAAGARPHGLLRGRAGGRTEFRAGFGRSSRSSGMRIAFSTSSERVPRASGARGRAHRHHLGYELLGVERLPEVSVRRPDSSRWRRRGHIRRRATRSSPERVREGPEAAPPGRGR
jgi:hypothetical protein